VPADPNPVHRHAVSCPDPVPAGEYGVPGGADAMPGDLVGVPAVADAVPFSHDVSARAHAVPPDAIGVHQVRTGRTELGRRHNLPHRASRLPDGRRLSDDGGTMK
jgi:hypothetical protein